MKAYKGFDKNLQCKGFQYGIGKEYECDLIKMCDQGFHSCENPLDVWDYYPPIDGNRFCDVEQSGEKETDGTKTVSSKIKIGDEIGIAGLVKAHIEWISEKTKSIVDKVLHPSKIAASYNTQIGSSGDGAQIGSSGNWAQIGSSGNGTKIGSSGDGAQIGSSGDWAQIGSSGNGTKIGSSGDWATIVACGIDAKIGACGDFAQIGASGDFAQIGSSGEESNIVASGDCATIWASGDYAKIGSSGEKARIECSGENAVVACSGKNNIVKAHIGTWVCLSEYNNEGICVCMKAFKIDGKKYPADTWLKIKNREIVEAVEGDDR